MRVDEKRAQVADVLRRCSFGARPGEVDRLAPAGPQALIAALLEADDPFVLDDDAINAELDPEDDEFERQFLTWLLDRMMTGEHRLHERMTWFWHTHFTTSAERSSPTFVWRQHHLVRRYALGDFADLARAITTDPAMLFYLDGVGSEGENPNENYAREFLELFTLGRDAGYSEDDVRAAARILAGWHVDWETGEVTFSRDRAYQRPVTFMGERRSWDVDSFVRFVCDLPACHRHVATQVHRYLVGSAPSPERLAALADTFQNSGLDVKALVEAIVTAPEFFADSYSRTRQPIEWLLAALLARGHRSVEEIELRPWQVDSLGQMPFRPPNVAGWPLDDRWSSPSQLVTRLAMVLDWELPELTISTTSPTVEAVLAQCGIAQVSDSTRAALDRIETEHSEYDYRLELMFASVLTSPEFSLL